MVRITAVDALPAGRTLKVEGRVAGSWADVVTRATLEALGASAHVALDLAGVTFVDREGVAVLQALRGRGVALVNETEFVASLLNGDPS